jgi:DNA mismatch endonuclease (patch repair protein)
MSRIKGKDTGLELRVAIFVDGDFWHGYLFPSWEDKVSDFWKAKISKTRERDAENHRRLSEMGWAVIRLWQHELEEDFEGCIERIVSKVKNAV